MLSIELVYGYARLLSQLGCNRVFTNIKPVDFLIDKLFNDSLVIGPITYRHDNIAEIHSHWVYS